MSLKPTSVGFQVFWKYCLYPNTHTKKVKENTIYYENNDNNNSNKQIKQEQQQQQNNNKKRFIGVSSFFKATKLQQLNGEKWDVGHLSSFGSAVLLCCFGVIIISIARNFALFAPNRSWLALIQLPYFPKQKTHRKKQTQNTSIMHNGQRDRPWPSAVGSNPSQSRVRDLFNFILWRHTVSRITARAKSLRQLAW